MKTGKSEERFSPAMGGVVWKTEVCLPPGHNQDVYSWGPSSLQSKGWRLWRWLWAWSCQAAAADTARRDFQTARLLSPSLLNHHHSSHLRDRWRDLSPVRAATWVPPAADSPNEAGGVPPPLCFPSLRPRHHASVSSAARAASSLRALCLRSLLSRSCDRLNSC